MARRAGRPTGVGRRDRHRLASTRPRFLCQHRVCPGGSATARYMLLIRWSPQFCCGVTASFPGRKIGLNLALAQHDVAANLDRFKTESRPKANCFIGRCASSMKRSRGFAAIAGLGIALAAMVVWAGGPPTRRTAIATGTPRVEPARCSAIQATTTRLWIRGAHEQHQWRLQHRHWCRAVRQHHRLRQHRLWIRGAHEQHQWRLQHRHWICRAVLQHHRL